MNEKGIHSSDWIFYGSPQETVCLHELCAFTDEIKIVEGCQPYA